MIQESHRKYDLIPTDTAANNVVKMVNLRTTEIAFLEYRSDTTLYQIHSESLENCHSHVLLF